MATGGLPETVTLGNSIEKVTSGENHESLDSKQTPMGRGKPDLALQIDAESDLIMKETTYALDTVSTPSDHFSFNDYGIIDTPTPRMNLNKNPAFALGSLSNNDLDLNQKEGDQSSQSSRIDQSKHKSSDPIISGDLDADSHRSNQNKGPVSDPDPDVDLFHTPLTSQTNLGPHPCGPTPYASEIGFQPNQAHKDPNHNGIYNLNLPPFLVADPVNLPPDHPDSFQRIEKTSKGFLSHSVDNKVDGNLGVVRDITWDEDLQHLTPLGQRAERPRLRPTRSPLRASQSSTPARKSPGQKLKQLTLTSLLYKKGRTLCPQPQGLDSGLGSGVCAPTPISDTETLGGSHPPQEQNIGNSIHINTTLADNFDPWNHN